MSLLDGVNHGFPAPAWFTCSHSSPSSFFPPREAGARCIRVTDLHLLCHIAQWPVPSLYFIQRFAFFISSKGINSMCKAL